MGLNFIEFCMKTRCFWMTMKHIQVLLLHWLWLFLKKYVRHERHIPLGCLDTRKFFFPSTQSWRLSSEQLPLVLNGMPEVNHTVGLAGRLRCLRARAYVCLRGSISASRATFRVCRQLFSHACLLPCRWWAWGAGWRGGAGVGGVGGLGVWRKGGRWGGSR